MDRLKHGLRRMVRNMPARKQANVRLEAHLARLGLRNMLTESAEAVDVLELVEKLDMRKSLLQQLLRHKNAKNSLDVNFLSDKLTYIEGMNAKIVQFAQEKLIAAADFEIVDPDESGILRQTIQQLARLDAEINVWNYKRAQEPAEIDIAIQRERKFALKWAVMKKTSRKVQLAAMKK